MRFPFDIIRLHSSPAALTSCVWNQSCAWLVMHKIRKHILYNPHTVDRQMLVIILIWRVEKIAKLKRRHHFPFHCKTFTSLRNFITLNDKFAQLKRRHLIQIVKIANLICRHHFHIYSKLV
jgi:hypothetical protein